MVDLCLVACSSEAPPTPAPQVLWYGGPVVSCVEGQPAQEALLQEGERVRAVGTLKEVEAQAHESVKRVDLKGHTLMCGFVDGHIHAERLGRPEWFVNTPEYVRNPKHPQYPYGPPAQDVVQLFRERVASTPPGTPAIALVSVTFWSSIGLNPRAVLDAVSTQHPIVAVSWGGHGMAVNSAALALGNYADGQPDPYSGRLGRTADGRLTGHVQELAELPIFQALSRKGFTEQDLVAHAQEYVEAAWRTGQVRGLSIPFMVTEDVADRVYSQVRGDFWRRACMLTAENEECTPFRGEEHVKIFTDGSPDRCDALVSVPYVRSETCPETTAPWFGLNTITPSQIDLALDRVQDGNRRLLVHALGDAAVGTILDRLEARGNRTWPNVTVEHGDLLHRPGDMARLRRLGVVLYQNPTHLVSVPPLSVARYTPELVAHSEPLRSLLDAGVTLAFASDDFEHPTPVWLQIQLAVTHPFRPSERITLQEAIAAWTRVAAAGRGWDDLGTLEPGKRASFQVLSRDPYTTPVPELANISSILTVMSGQVEWTAGVVDTSHL